MTKVGFCIGCEEPLVNTEFMAAFWSVGVAGTIFRGVVWKVGAVSRYLVLSDGNCQPSPADPFEISQSMSRPDSLCCFIRGSQWMGTVCLALACLGCGLSAYEDRLQRTAVFYEYLQAIEENLSPAWFHIDPIMSMRPPKPFRIPLPGPTKEKDQLGKEVIGEDPRQQNALGIELPGLVEGWSASLESGTPDEPDTWIYVLTNHDRFTTEGDQGPDPKAFFTDLENMLTTLFQVNVPAGESPKPGDNVRFRYQSPSTNSPHAQYTKVKDYIAIRYVPHEPVNGRDLHAFLYERQAGDVQAALLVVCPKSTSAQFRQRLDLALETWEIDQGVPKRSRPQQPGAAPPASSAPTSQPRSQPGGTSGF
jgi:hypothetical protein